MAVAVTKSGIKPASSLRFIKIAPPGKKNHSRFVSDFQNYVDKKLFYKQGGY